MLDGREVDELSKKDITRNVGFVSQNPFIFSGTIQENLLYGCLANTDGGQNGGNDRMPTLDDIIAVLQQTGIFVDVLRFGLNTVLKIDQDQESNGREPCRYSRMAVESGSFAKSVGASMLLRVLVEVRSARRPLSCAPLSLYHSKSILKEVRP